MKPAAAIIAAIVLVLALVYALCPRPDLKDYVPYSTVYLDREGELLRLSLAQDQRYRVYQRLEDIPAQMIEATLLYEDQNFHQHNGVDLPALMRAFWTTYVSRERRVGASTIVMQVARLKWGIASGTLSGKLHQILRALQIVRHYSKHDILESYFNLAPYAGNIEGIGAASHIYFDKKPSQLNLAEVLTLAVIPQNPNKRNPATEKGFGHLLQARSVLFDRWVEKHPEDAGKRRYLELPLSVRAPLLLPFKAPHFVDYVTRQQSPWDHGYIHTTLNTAHQRRLETVLRQYVASRAASGIRNASALLLNYQSMSIEALMGSADFFDDSLQGQVNAATAKRSPGSTLKPFVYALALDAGLVHPESMLKDSPSRFGGFTPENYDRQFLGPVSVKQALIQSRNVPAVYLQSELKKPGSKGTGLYDFLKQAGVSGLRRESHYGLALGLGGAEVSMIELATLYAALANNGVLQPLKSSVDAAPQPARSVFSKEASFLVLDMLKDIAAPDDTDLIYQRPRNNEVAWKTGTSWAFRDAWAVGISGPYVLVVWVGNFDGSGNQAFIGRSAAGPLLFSIFDAIYPGQGWKVSDTVTSQHLNLKKLRVCAASGDLYEKYCPASKESWFIPGVSPIRVSNIYRRIPIDRETGLRACWHEEGKTDMKVYQFWPSDLLTIFNQAGISLNTPPAYARDCTLEQQSASGQMPVITSPQSSIEYVVVAGPASDQRIPLLAIVDADVTSVHWFVDDDYIGSADNGKVLMWEARPGDYQLRAVDDHARSVSKRVRVSRYN